MRVGGQGGCGVCVCREGVFVWVVEVGRPRACIGLYVDLFLFVLNKSV